jgi:ABC-type antimicrobial peptide transport system permease subunit
MTIHSLAGKSLRYYWRTNLAVAAGVAVAVGVLGGALLVGASVRASLMRIALERLGAAGSAVVSGTLFREALAAELGDAVPLIALEGAVRRQASTGEAGARASQVQVYGVDERFWKFHGVEAPAMARRAAWLSPALAAELNPKPGDAVLVRIEKPTDIPAESLHGRREDAPRALRLRFGGVAAAERMGEFSLRSSQAAVRAVFVPIEDLQREIDAAGRVNLLLSRAEDVAHALREKFSIDDLGLRVAPAEGGLQVDSRSGVLSEALVSAISGRAGAPVSPMLAYLANSILANGRETPYSLVVALPPPLLPAGDVPENGIVLNDWTARDLGAKPGDAVRLEYYAWKDDGRLVTESADFVLSAVVPIAGTAADRKLTPDYPGISDATSIGNWDPPFPMNLKKIRPKDEEFWDRYRTTAKAFVPLARGQQLWGTRWGKVTGLRIAGKTDPAELSRSIRDGLDPARFGLTAIPVRREALEASRGAADFGEYFVYFSFFLIVSALLLAGLFFRFGVEQRTREIGLLEAVGLTARPLRGLFLREVLALSAAGSFAGAGLAVLYAEFVLYGLRTWWAGASGTAALALRVDPAILAAASVSGVGMGLAVTFLTVRRLLRETPRALLLGAWNRITAAAPSRAARWAAGLTAFAFALAASGAAGTIPAAGAFFGSGLALLAGALSLLKSRLSAGAGGVDSMWGLALRNLGVRPGRTVLIASLIAAATFLVVSVEAFRRDGEAGEGSRLIAESAQPLYYNPNSEQGRNELNLNGIDGVRFTSFRLRPGEDVSCLNLFAPRNPRVLGAPAEFASRAGDPWSLLGQAQPDNAVAALADANSLQYVLHKKVGDIIGIPGTEVRLRIVGALADSVFQGEIIIAESDFVRVFPESQGWRVFLIDVEGGKAVEKAAELEEALADYGFDAQTVEAKLAAFHRVENTYLATFQFLGILGLLLGTLGMGAVLLRNVLERRREFALLAATGFRPAMLRALAMRESVLMLVCGQGAGIAAAIVATAPIVWQRGMTGSFASLLAMNVAVSAAGLVACWLGGALVSRLPLVSALRAD